MNFECKNCRKATLILRNVPSSNSSAQNVYFVEVQFQKNQLLYHRFFAEMFVYLDQNPATRDWQAVVVYPQRSLEPNESNLYRALLESPQVQRVYLDELAVVAPSLGLGLGQTHLNERQNVIVTSAL